MVSYYTSLSLRWSDIVHWCWIKLRQYETFLDKNEYADIANEDNINYLLLNFLILKIDCAY